MDLPAVGLSVVNLEDLPAVGLAMDLPVSLPAVVLVDPAVGQAAVGSRCFVSGLR